MKIEINALGEILNADEPWVKWLLFSMCLISMRNKGFIRDTKTCWKLNAVPECNLLGGGGGNVYFKADHSSKAENIWLGSWAKDARDTWLVLKLGKQLWKLGKCCTREQMKRATALTLAHYIISASFSHCGEPVTLPIAQWTNFFSSKEPMTTW